MKTNPPSDAKFKVSRTIEIARVRLADAESALASAKEQMRLARQRRKAAKQAAKRAKKQHRLAKENVATLRLSLDNLETKFATLAPAPAERKPIKTVVKKARAVRRRGTSARVITTSPKVAKKKTSAARTIRGKRPALPAQTPAESPGGVALELETPVELLPESAHKPTPQIVEAVQEMFAKAASDAESHLPMQDAGTLPETPEPTSQTETAL